MEERKDTVTTEEYRAEAIDVVEGLDHVRARPAMYIGDISERGLHHLVWELIDNAVDEAMAGFAKKYIRCNT